MINLIANAIPFFLVSVAVEAWALRHHSHDHEDDGDRLPQRLLHLLRFWREEFEAHRDIAGDILEEAAAAIGGGGARRHICRYKDIFICVKKMRAAAQLERVAYNCFGEVISVKVCSCEGRSTGRFSGTSSQRPCLRRSTFGRVSEKGRRHPSLKARRRPSAAPPAAHRARASRSARRRRDARRRGRPDRLPPDA